MLWLAVFSALLTLGPSNEEPAFLTERAVLWLGSTQVVAFEITTPHEVDVSFAAEVSDPSVVRVLRAPKILAGRTIGFLRLEALREGETTLSIGASHVLLDVRPASVQADARRVRASITAPVPGAVVWGRFHAGVEVWPGTNPDAALDVRLETSSGRTLLPERVLPRSFGTWRRVVFVIDADELPPGELQLTPVVLDATGDEIARGGTVEVHAVRPGEGQVFGGECEDTIASERPPAFGTELPNVGTAPDASGGRFVVNVRPDPTWLFHHEVERAGRYQMMITARGDFAAGALPSAALCRSDPNDQLTSVRLVDEGWQRIPLGLPVMLEAGPQVLAVRFVNDYTLGSADDRNLYLDRFELLHLEENAPIEASAGMTGSAMSVVSMITGRAGATDGAAEGSDRGLSIAFDRPLDGLPVNGRLGIQGFCRWDGAGEIPAPHVELLVDGEVVERQQAAQPVFAIDRSSLSPGPNRLQLVATLADGRRAATPVQTVYVLGDNTEGAAREMLRYGVVDEHWSGLEEALSGEGEEPGHLVARFAPGTRGEIPLPVDLEGQHDVILRARGPQAPEVGRLRVALKTPAGEEDLGEVPIQNWWNYVYVTTETFSRGPKTLVVERPLGEGEGEGEGEGNPPILRAAILRSWSPPDRSPPRARILYPSAEHVVFAADTVIVEAHDDDRLMHADLLIDGRPQGTYGFVPEGVGHVVLPLLARTLAPGEHTLRVRVTDRAGNLGDSRELRFHVSAEEPVEPGPYARAVRLLNRFAYGPDPRELAAVLTMGERAWLEARLADFGPGDRAALAAGEARMQNSYAYFVNRATVNHAIRTDNPVRTRFVAWVENHFSTWMGKTQGPAEWSEHQRYLRLGAAPFGELLLTSATSPAMIVYLDQQQSFAGRLNENYAREIMELHTLGVNGGYTQEEVTTLARLLTGLTISREALPNGAGGGMLARRLRFDPRLGAGGPCELLGMRFEATASAERFDRFLEVLELLVAHPSTAEYVSRELAEHYVSVPAPDELVADLARVFRETGGDMAAVLIALAEHPSFWTADLSAKVATPYDWAIRLARTTDVFAMDWAVLNYLRRSAMEPYDRSTPDGYPEDDDAWTDTNGMLQRWRLVQEVPWAVRNLVSDPVRRPPPGDLDGWYQLFVDLAAVRLTGWPLAEESNRAALDFAASYSGNEWNRVDQTAVMVCRLTEAQLR